MTTDASLEGWAVVVGDAAFSAAWDEEDRDDIALLEMKAVLLGLQAFFDHPAPPLAIHLSTDNTVTKAYINHMGGKIPCYDALAHRIWRFSEEREMFLVAFYVPSEENRADELTRLGLSRRANRIVTSEFKLLPRWFHEACAKLNVSPEIDCFASNNTVLLDRFCAWETPLFLMVLRILGRMMLDISFPLFLFFPGC